MKKNVFFGFLLAFIASFMTVQSLQAQDIVVGGSGLRLVVTGPVGQKPGHTLGLSVVVTNTSAAEITVASLQAAVIDPWTGQVFVGPSIFHLSQALTHGESSAPVSVSLKIPPAVPPNRVLAVVVYALDSNSIVRGTTGWAFATN